jgi:hypothetical protein
VIPWATAKYPEIMTKIRFNVGSVPESLADRPSQEERNLLTRGKERNLGCDIRWRIPRSF